VKLSEKHVVVVRHGFWFWF